LARICADRRAISTRASRDRRRTDRAAWIPCAP
jgi:hypothetical protein